MTIRRINTFGREYQLHSLEPGRTIVSLDGVEIVVDASLDRMNQAWYNWTMKGQFVQDAFKFLNAGQREFLLTGITEERWKQIFSEVEK